MWHELWNLATNLKHQKKTRPLKGSPKLLTSLWIQVTSWCWIKKNQPEWKLRHFFEKLRACQNGIQGKGSQHLRGHDGRGGFAGMFPGIWWCHLHLMYLWNRLRILINPLISLGWLIGSATVASIIPQNRLVPRSKIVNKQLSFFAAHLEINRGDALFNTCHPTDASSNHTCQTKRVCALKWQNPNCPNTLPTLYQETPSHIVG